jgi:hypothetical protein
VNKKLRFEVFKRDSFTCQYCGQSAPKVILEIDHINPKCEGGQDDILNLVTSCFDCNRGKGKKKLSDNSALEKQKAALDQLNKKREQLEMIIKWREELNNLQEVELEYINKIIIEKMECTLNEIGENKFRKLLKKYGLSEVVESMDISINQYYKNGENESKEKAINYTEFICRSRKSTKNNPELLKLYYMRGILRNRLAYLNEWQALKYLKDAFDIGISLDLLKELCLNCRNWTDFRSTIEELINEKK